MNQIIHSAPRHCVATAFAHRASGGAAVTLKNNETDRATGGFSGKYKKET
jgi:hypothetical protein